MHDAPDLDLLRKYAHRNSDVSFATLVQRHVNMVYSAALRKTGNPHAAEEITQAVFIILAKKAGSLRDGTVLSGWLYQTTRLTAANYFRTETRRAHREQEAYMQSLSNETDSEMWQQIAPHLEDAMGQLGEKDRNAIALRFFEGKSFQEVGTAFGASENAAKKRVAYALEKLRKYFSKRGIVSTTAIIAGVVSANSVQAAPVVLTTSIVATAVEGSAVATSVLTLVEGTMKMMTWMKMKLALGVSVAVLFTGGIATVAVSQVKVGADSKMTSQEIAEKSQAAYAALSSYSDTGTVTAETVGQPTTTTFSIRLQRPNLYRIEWSQSSGSYTSKGFVWSQGKGYFFMMGAAGREQNMKPEMMKNMQEALASATGVSSQAASTIPGTFFKQNWGDVLTLPASDRTNTKRQSDEKIGGVDCFVLSTSVDSIKLPDNTGDSGNVTMTLWIGKNDHLIHQSRTTTEGASIALPQFSDARIKKLLERQKKAATPEAIAAYRLILENAGKKTQSGKYVFTQTHENIIVNRKLAEADFAP